MGHLCIILSYYQYGGGDGKDEIESKCTDTQQIQDWSVLCNQASSVG